MSWRRRRNPDGRGPFPVEGGEPYAEPSMGRFEVRSVRAKPFAPYQEIPAYEPDEELSEKESRLLEGGAGLSPYFQETRTPVEVELAREQTEQLRRQLTSGEELEHTRLSLISQLATLPFGDYRVTQQAIASLSTNPSGVNVQRQFYRAPAEIRANVANDLAVFKRLLEPERAQALGQKQEDVRKVVAETKKGTRRFVTTTGELVEEVHPSPYLRRVRRR